MPEWRDMFGKELQVGYWVAIPGRGGQKGTRPLTAGWYQIESLRQDDERDWIIRFAGDRYQWLLSWDTLPASDQQERPRYDHELSKRIPAADVQPGDWLYVPVPVNNWFQVADYPSSSEISHDEILIPLVGHEPAVFNLNSKASIRDENPNDSEKIHWLY